MEKLTSREFWMQHWESHKNDFILPLSSSNSVVKIITQIINSQACKNIIELGGFPGVFSAYIAKNLNAKTTLLDYVIHPEVISNVHKAYDLSEKTLSVIEADLFNYTTTQTYDLVFSIGLIEHFDDTKLLIEIHTHFMQEKGQLLILIPNFIGLNGWLQRMFDIENYKVHNIKCMNIDLLENCCTAIGLKNIEVKYYGNFGTWLERESEKPLGVRIFRKLLNIFGKAFFRIFKFESKFFSPYILITASK